MTTDERSPVPPPWSSALSTTPGSPWRGPAGPGRGWGATAGQR